MENIQRKSGLKAIPSFAPEASILRAQLLYRGDLRQMLKRAAAGETSLVVDSQSAIEQSEHAVALLDTILE